MDLSLSMESYNQPLKTSQAIAQSSKQLTTTPHDEQTDGQTE